MSSIDAKKATRDLLKGTYAVNGFYGFPDLAANTDDIVSQILDGSGYTTAEIAEFVSWFSVRGVMPVLSEYPRRPKDLPAVFVFRIGDTEMASGVIGDLIATEDGTDPDLQAKEIYGVYFDEQIQINLWGIEPNQRDILYLALRELILRGRLWYAALDLKIEWKNGKDGQFYLEQADPHIIHTAQATLFVTTYTQWAEEGAKVLKITSRAKTPIRQQGEVTANEYGSISPPDIVGDGS